MRTFSSTHLPRHCHCHLISFIIVGVAITIMIVIIAIVCLTLDPKTALPSPPQNAFEVPGFARLLAASQSTRGVLQGPRQLDTGYDIGCDTTHTRLPRGNFRNTASTSAALRPSFGVGLQASESNLRCPGKIDRTSRQTSRKSSPKA